VAKHTIRSEPIYSKISKTAIALDHHVAEILGLRPMAVIHIAICDIVTSAMVPPVK
jgi:hypothetical protein